MNEFFPLTPSLGMPTHWYLLLTFAIGALFGFSLERAGFGSAKRITAIFTLRDFRVFRVMFTAVLTAMLGAHLLQYAGVLNLSLIYIEKNYFWSLVVGGMLFGFGFYFGGFCPGTAPVAGIRGRWDGFIFLFGAIIGIWGFALLYDAVGATAWFRNFFAPTTAQATTLYGDGPAWPWILLIMAAAFGGFLVVPWVEKRFALRTVAELKAQQEGLPAPERPPVVWPTYWRWLGPTAAAAAAGAIIWLETTEPQPQLLRDMPRTAVDLGTNVEQPSISAQTLAGWLIENAHRAEDGDEPNATVLDLRSPTAVKAVTIPGTVSVDLTNAVTVDAQLAAILSSLKALEAPMDQPVVLLTETGAIDARLLERLQARRVWAQFVQGGAQAWLDDVVHWQPDAKTPGFAGSNVVALTTETANDAQWMQAAVAVSANPYQFIAWMQAKTWLSGDAVQLPPRFVFPNAVPPEAQLAAAVATGAAESGGCN